MMYLFQFFADDLINSLVITLKGRIHCEIFLSEYFMKYWFNVNFIAYLYIKFQLNCFFTLSWNISVKEIFSFQKETSSKETASRVISSIVLIA